MDLRRHALDPSMADKWSAVSHPSNHRIVLSSDPLVNAKRAATGEYKATPDCQNRGKGQAVSSARRVSGPSLQASESPGFGREQRQHSKQSKQAQQASTARKNSKQAQQASIHSKHSKQAYHSKHSNQASHQASKQSTPERGRRQGAKPFRFAAPPKGEQGVLNQISESAESEA